MTVRADPPSEAAPRTAIPRRPTSTATTRAGVGAVVASALTLFAMALVATGRGSPYQPILTPNGEPEGWLRDLARSVGIEDVHGNASLALGVTATAAAVVAFLWLLRVARRGDVGLAPIALIVVAAHVLIVFVPLLFSRDVYSYAYYGRIEGVYGANPYVETPLDRSDDPLWTYVGPKWVDTPAVYGPAWTRLSSELAEVLPRAADHVEAYRWIAIGASLAACAGIVVVVRGLRPDRTAYALAAFGANPIVLFHSVASGHNDLLVALALVLAAGFLAARWHVAAVVALTLGALVKATAALPLLLLIVWLVAGRPPGERWRALVRATVPAVVVGLVFAVPYLQLDDPTRGMRELASHEGWLAPSAVLGRLLDLLSFDTLGWVVRLVFGLLLVRAVVTLGKVVARHASGDRATVTTRTLPGDDRRDRIERANVDEVIALWGWSLVLLALLGPVLLPWYVVWALPLVWILPREPRVALLATSALLAVTLWSAEPLRFPGAFDLNLFVGRWIVTPVLLILALRALRDVRRRADLGLAFADRRSAAGPAGGPSHGEERVPASAGDR